MGTLWGIMAAVVPVLIGIGLTMIALPNAAPIEFWVARACFSLSALLLCVVTLVWELKTDSSLLYRIAGGCAVGALVFVLFPVSIHWVNDRAGWNKVDEIPLPSVSANFLKHERSSDYEIAGIKWQSAYSGLHVNFVNRSEKYEGDLNVRLKLNALVAKIGCLEHSGNSQISFEPWTAARVNDNIHNGVLLATDLGYLMYCSHIPPQGHVTIVMALVGKPRQIDSISGFDDPRFNFGLNVEERGDKGLNVFGNDPLADIYSARPTPPLSLTVDGVFTAAQQDFKMSQRINIEPKSHTPLAKNTGVRLTQPVTPENVESYIAEWIDSLGVDAKTINSPDTYFAYEISFSDDFPVGIYRLKNTTYGADSYVIMHTNFALSEIDQGIFDQRSPADQQEFARAFLTEAHKINGDAVQEGRFPSIKVAKIIPTAGLTEEKFKTMLSDLRTDDRLIQELEESLLKKLEVTTPSPTPGKGASAP